MVDITNKMMFSTNLTLSPNVSIGTIVNQSSNSAIRLLINSVVWSIIRLFGFVFIRPSGFGRMDKWTSSQFVTKISFWRSGFDALDPALIK